MCSIHRLELKRPTSSKSMIVDRTGIIVARQVLCGAPVGRKQDSELYCLASSFEFKNLSVVRSLIIQRRL